MAPSYEVTCPTCNAAPGDRCRTLTTDRATDTHTARLDANTAAWATWISSREPTRD